MQGFSNRQLEVPPITRAEHEAQQRAKREIPVEAPSISGQFSLHVRGGNTPVRTHVNGSHNGSWIEIAAHPLTLVLFVDSVEQARTLSKGFDDLARDIEVRTRT